MSDVAPISVNVSNKLALATMVFRYMGTGAAGMMSLLGFARSKDIAGLVAYAQSDAVLPFLTALAALGLMAWAAAQVILNKRVLVKVANAAPDSVAVVKGAA